jgi:hypothetical protein
MKNSELSQSCAFPNEVNIQLHMLRSLTMHRVVREICRGDIITEDDARLLDDDVQFHQQVPQPAALSGGIRDTTVLRFGRGSGDDGLAL